MTSLATLPLAAVLAFGLASSAQAWSLPGDITPHRSEVTRNANVTAYESAVGSYGEEPTPIPYARCHGQSSGMADASCGTRTGGPSGGLF